MKHGTIASGVLLGFGLTLCTPLWADNTTRILNGTTASTTTYPWMASLNIAAAEGVGSFGCGGSLIAPNWVLTAAHCYLNSSGNAVDQSLAGTTTVTLKSNDIFNLDEDAVQVKGKRIIAHPSYNPDQSNSSNTNDNDIALLELEQAVNNVNPVTLHINNSPALTSGSKAIVMGWGGIDANATNTSDTLLQVEQQLLSNNRCSEMMGAGITSNMICGGGFSNTDNSDSCQGDSGGPLVLAHQSGFLQIGIVSYGGATCGNPQEAGVYTRVSKYQQFISQYVPGATFTSSGNACAGISLDERFNLNIPCLDVYGARYATALNLDQQGALAWDFSGSLSATNCNPAANVCATLDDGNNFILPGIMIGEEKYTVELDFVEPWRWEYSEHYAD